MEYTYTQAIEAANKIAPGLLVMGILPTGITLITVSDCTTIYDGYSDYGTLVGPRCVDVTKATIEEIAESQKLEAQRIKNENRKPVRQYRRRY
jgi:hypothetical protein